MAAQLPQAQQNVVVFIETKYLSHRLWWGMDTRVAIFDRIGDFYELLGINYAQARQLQQAAVAANHGWPVHGLAPAQEEAVNNLIFYDENN